ncbi:hypothetical protein AWU65_07265 [Paenibacillus glucanolyticus]|uniref:Uncharacterized protein n=1 Tax=Paenibacillus glucanolyticus TaxID=59843 RepID=A0A163HZG1_9BACL|nr:hypothetical protein [Paenibacillus glucanolyticus]KZS45726.1 hypothetical protein AWU65_07265 [Paenibacillus glucanolyticus]
MVKSYAKFTAEIQKGINIKGSDVEMKILIPLKAAQPYLNFLSNSQGNEVNIFVGDPQMAFDFEEDEDDAYKLYQGGRRVTADASGVVTSIEQPDELKDENQAELDLEGAASEAESEGNEEHSGDPAGDPTPADDGDELNDYEMEIMGEGSTQEGSDLPEWMQEQQQVEKPDGQEMSFEDSGQDTATNGVSEVEEPQASSDEEISKEALEQFILKERPLFEDIPLDFPELLERKRTGEVTWRELANSVGMTSGQLNGKYAKYKEAVKQQMKSNGVA